MGRGDMKQSLPMFALLCAAPAFAGSVWDSRDISEGQGLYAEQCATCHGDNLEGQPNWRSPDDTGVLPAPPHDETGHTWHHDSQLLFGYTKLGGQIALAEMGVSGFQSGMPAFGDALSDEEIWNILAYIRSTWPPKIQEIQTERSLP